MFSHSSRRRRFTPLLLTILLALGLLCPAPAWGAEARFTELSDFNGVSMGAVTGTVFDRIFSRSLTDLRFFYYDDLSSMLLSLENGNVDILGLDEPVARLAAAENSALAVFPQTLEEEAYAFGLQKDSPLTDRVSAAIEGLLADGSINALRDKWFSGDEARMKVEIPTYTADNGVLRYAHDSVTRPMSYVDGSGASQGYEVELVYLIGQVLGMRVEITQSKFGSLINMLDSDMADIVSGAISVTAERRESIDFATPHYQGGMVILARAADLAAPARFRGFSDFDNTQVAISTGSAFNEFLDPYADNVEYKFYDDVASQMLALTGRDVDAVVLDMPVAQLAVAQTPDTVIFPDILLTAEYGLALQKNSPYTADFSRVIEQFQADGTLAALQDKWFSGDPARMKLERPQYTAENGTLRYVYDYTLMPMGYADGSGAAQGYEVELVCLIGRELGLAVEIVQEKFASLFSDLESDRADVASGSMFITEERAQSVDFPTSHYQGGVVLVIRAEDSDTGVAAQDDVSWWQKLQESFYKTFIKEARWLLILRGLGVTALISIASALCGTLLSFPFYLARNCRWAWLRRLAALFIRIIQSLPVVVFLMILYYLVFRGVRIDAVLVSIIAFSVNFGVYVAEMLRSGIGAVPPGQAEASLAMGFSRWQTYTGVILPQAARHILPVYRGEFISMLKSTSMVGYIAVQDLTKVGDIVRSNTFEAMFPLLSIALLYFILANVLVALLSVVEKKTDPGRRPRVIKGVTEL